MPSPEMMQQMTPEQIQQMQYDAYLWQMQQMQNTQQMPPIAPIQPNLYNQQGKKLRKPRKPGYKSPWEANDSCFGRSSRIGRRRVFLPTERSQS